ncbi:uncharacterized protein OE_1048F [Halobacterium salinarum R1]|uniref:Uncharacterized protein n=2 Tax=Halobacterium salinarum NRC-34001 TaxID=2886895 RepID=A0A510N3Q9_HALSA|nr:uncharacterized protein OE_1048F [Halobacterium salinarum R1]DAC77356.1 TPA_inf: uncharacterized protein VNG_0029a [Halobacterium salinarum NRC-1]
MLRFRGVLPHSYSSAFHRAFQLVSRGDSLLVLTQTQSVARGVDCDTSEVIRIIFTGVQLPPPDSPNSIPTLEDSRQPSDLSPTWFKHAHTIRSAVPTDVLDIFLNATPRLI